MPCWVRSGAERGTCPSLDAQPDTCKEAQPLLWLRLLLSLLFPPKTAVLSCQGGSHLCQTKSCDMHRFASGRKCPVLVLT